MAYKKQVKKREIVKKNQSVKTKDQPESVKTKDQPVKKKQSVKKNQSETSKEKKSVVDVKVPKPPSA